MRARMTLAAIAAWLLGGGIAAQAAYTVPAVNLPAQTPEAVRDRVARSLASTRDQIGRVLHPFRGEFHGLGGYAVDLSGDGRVVVGYDWDISTRSNRPFVWSPATGKKFYEMLPSGATGQPLPTTISADGVYVAGILDIKYGGPAFRWSLAGPENLVSVESKHINPTALSRSGSVLAGTYRTPYMSTGNGPTYSSDLVDSDGDGVSVLPGQRTWAFRYTRAKGIEEPGVLPSGNQGFYFNSAAVDITSDGSTVLVNGLNSSEHYGSESFLWTADGSLRSLGNYHSGDDGRYTIGNAISADGSTVVGINGYQVDDIGLYGDERAALWRAETGWIELGELKTIADPQVLAAWANEVSGDGSVVLGQALVMTDRIEGGVNRGLAMSYTPFLWDEARGMRELADVLRLDYGLDLTGWSLAEATGISDDGTTIIGNGRNTAGQGGAWRAVLQRNTPLGDIDFDGDIDPQDYAQLTSNLGANSTDSAVFYADGDLNADGRVDQSDAATLLGLYQGRRQGDFNADGVVNLADYTVWRDHVGQFTGGLADSNGDGWVNGADLAAWRTHFGRSLGALFPFSIPEPTTATLIAAAAIAFMSRRR